MELQKRVNGGYNGLQDRGKFLERENYFLIYPEIAYV